MTRLAAAVLALLLLGAGPAGADDVFDIDGRLQEAGIVDAVVDVLVSEDSARITVDFDVRETADAEEYEAQALQAAELVWDHLEVQVGAVDVQPTYAAPWLDEQLPPALSYTRRDLETGFGPRPAGLDDETDPYAAAEGQEDVYLDGGFFLLPVLGGAVVLLLLVAIGLLVALLVRRRPEPAAGVTGWGAPPPAPPSGSPQAPPPGDPWQTPRR